MLTPGYITDNCSKCIRICIGHSGLRCSLGLTGKMSFLLIVSLLPQLGTNEVEFTPCLCAVTQATVSCLEQTGRGLTQNNMWIGVAFGSTRTLFLSTERTLKQESDTGCVISKETLNDSSVSFA